jgi:endonuclease I
LASPLVCVGDKPAADILSMDIINWNEKKGECDKNIQFRVARSTAGFLSHATNEYKLNLNIERSKKMDANNVIIFYVCRSD